MSAISLSVPARAEFVHVVRSVTASVGALLNFSYDDIEDLRLAVDEACAFLLSMCSPTAVLTLEIAALDGGVEVLASIDAEALHPPADTRNTIVWHILGALTDAAAMEETGRGPGIRFTKRVAS